MGHVQADIIYDIYVVMGTVPLPFCVLAVSTSTSVHSDANGRNIPVSSTSLTSWDSTHDMRNVTEFLGNVKNGASGW